MVTQRSAESKENRTKAKAMNPALALQAPDPWACRHGTCFAAQPVIMCTPAIYFSAWVWHHALQEDRDRQLSLCLDGQVKD